jgi:two-component system, OmpR family, sensor histidine kinase ChvG
MDPRPGWSGRLPLATRILAVNALPLALLAGSFFYLDGFRSRLIAERQIQAVGEARLLAKAIGVNSAEPLSSLVETLGRGEPVRIRVIGPQGRLLADNWAGHAPSIELRDPAQENWRRKVAFALDETVDWLVGAEVPPPYDPAPRFIEADVAGTALSLAPDRTHMIEAWAPLAGRAGELVTTVRNARDIRRFVRAERSNLGTMLGLATLISVLLSLFLARTIVDPLRRLAQASRAVRFGQAREVEIPRLPERSDDIGRLARAVSDMSLTLRARMDAIEAFAADVAHELKNPLASMASAVQTLGAVHLPDQQHQLHAIIADDVRRLDRLVTDISDLSRLDAQIAWTRFEPVDLGPLVEGLLKVRKDRGADAKVQLAFARPKAGSATVRADAFQITRLIDNLLDNAVSFSPEGGTVRIAVTRSDGEIQIAVDDDGPGVPENQRGAIFERFHSNRPDEEFGRHSGLGLAIAKTITDAHGGSIRATSRDLGHSGARFVVTLAPVRAAL